jgi:hypothetical protein
LIPRNILVEEMNIKSKSTWHSQNVRCGGKRLNSLYGYELV